MFEYLISPGVAKAGTTLLYDLLQKHPQIRRGQVKELHYFDYAENPVKAEYDEKFLPGQGLKMDITPMYMCRADCVDKMAATLDPRKVALVVLLRDPVERALSHYKMRISQNLEKRSFEQCFDQEPGKEYPRIHDLRMTGYFPLGLYAPQLESLYRRFPPENIQVYLFEDFVKNQQAYVDKVCRFLGIEPIQVHEMHSNKSVVHVKSRLAARLIWNISRFTPNAIKRDWMRKLKYKLASANERKDAQDNLDPQLVRRLTDYYRQDVETLATRYGLDTSRWKHFA